MAQEIGDMYYLGNPIRLYYDSIRAATWDWTLSGMWYKTGYYEIVNMRWGKNRKTYTSDPGNAVPLYALKDLGWVRDDDNIFAANFTDLPASISSESSSFQIKVNKSTGTNFEISARTSSTTWYSYSSNTTQNNSNAATINALLTGDVKDSLYSSMRNVTSASTVVTVSTYHQGNLVGSNTQTMTVNIPASIGPSFTTNPTFATQNKVGTKVFAGYSEIVLTNKPVAVAGRGASISKTYINLSNLTKSLDNRWLINAAGKAQVDYVVEDTRGRKKTISYSDTAVAGSAISITSFTSSRTGSKKARLRASGAYLASLDGTPKYTLKRRERGTTSWTDIVSKQNTTISNDIWSLDYTTGELFEGGKSYEFQLIVSGSTTSATGQSLIGTEALPFSFGMHGFAAGKEFSNTDQAMLQVGTGGIDSDGPIKVGGTIIGSSPTEIPSGANLNDYRTTGEYYLEHIPSPFNITNFPSSSGRFYLKVTVITTGTTIIGTQVLQNRQHNDNTAIYFRSFSGTSFSDWKDLTEVGSGGGTPIDTSGFYSDNNPGYTYHTDPENPAIRWMRFNSGFTLSWGTINSTSEIKAISFGRQFQAMPIVTAIAYNQWHRPVLNTLSLILASNGIHYSGISFRITEAKTGAAWSLTDHGTAGIDYMVMGVS